MSGSSPDVRNGDRVASRVVIAGAPYRLRLSAGADPIALFKYVGCTIKGLAAAVPAFNHTKGES